MQEARTGFWDQVGRIGYEVGLSYKPIDKINIRTGWHAGSNFWVPSPTLVWLRAEMDTSIYALTGQ